MYEIFNDNNHVRFGNGKYIQSAIKINETNVTVHSFG